MRTSYSENKGVVFVITTIVLSACAQLLMKFGMLTLAHTDRTLSQLFDLNIISQPAILWVLAGLACYAVSMLFWLAALSKYELSFAYPLLSLSYVLVYLGAVLWPGFHESASWLRSLGIVVIIIGVTLVTQAKPNNIAG